jgi:hypothetical protein
MSTTLAISNHCKTILQQLFEKIFQIRAAVVKSSLATEENFSLVER